MAVRVPSILDETIERNPDYPPSVTDALRRLRDDIAGDGPFSPHPTPTSGPKR